MKISSLGSSGYCEKNLQKLNGILPLNNVLSPTLNAVNLTKPGAVRPDLEKHSSWHPAGLRHVTYTQVELKTIHFGYTD